jgi:hypothetical protein
MATAAALRTMKIGLHNIRVDSDLQSRCKLDVDYVHKFSERMICGDEFPALEVFFDGQAYWLADGFHRHAAALRASLRDFRCNVRHGTREDAIVHSAGSNREFSIERTAADIRRAAFMLFAFDEWLVKPAGEVATFLGIRARRVEVLLRSYCKANKLKPPRPLPGVTPPKRHNYAPGPYRPNETTVTLREKKAVEGRLAGKTHAEIAADLGVSRRGVGLMLERVAERNEADLHGLSQVLTGRLVLHRNPRCPITSALRDLLARHPDRDGFDGKDEALGAIAAGELDIIDRIAVFFGLELRQI